MKQMIEYKLFENLQKARKLLADNRIPETDPQFKKLREMLSANPGYIGQFTKWLFGIDDAEKETEVDDDGMVRQRARREHRNPTPFSELEEIYKALKTIRIDKPIEDFKRAEDLYDYIQSFEINKKTNQVINAIPSKARELVTDKLRDLISLNSDVAPLLKDFYSKKGGKFKTSKDLYNDTYGLIENIRGGFNLETIKKKAQGLNAEAVLESPEMLILAVYDFPASSKLGSKSWCISNSQSYWNNYVNEFTTQYFIYDFTKPISDNRHMIGVTVSPSGSFHAAHFADDAAVRDYSIFDDL